MRKYVLVLSVLGMIALGIGLFLNSPRQERPDTAGTRLPLYSWSEMRTIHQEHQVLETAWQGLAHFHQLLEEVKAAILSGGVPLEEAADTVVEAALRHNPRFLESMAMRYPGETRRGGIIRYLLHHLEFAASRGALTTFQVEVLNAVRMQWMTGI
jgi:hypothetical protein